MTLCGDRSTLQRFLLGNLSEQDSVALERHLEQCPRFLDALTQLNVTDTLFEALRQAPSGDTPPEAAERIPELVASASRLGATPDDANLEGPGTVMGVYTLMEQIGEGGFGLVFVAEQSQPVHRRVALKVLQPGMDT